MGKIKIQRSKKMTQTILQLLAGLREMGREQFLAKCTTLANRIAELALQCKQETLNNARKQDLSLAYWERTYEGGGLEKFPTAQPFCRALEISTELDPKYPVTLYCATTEKTAVQALIWWLVWQRVKSQLSPEDLQFMEMVRCYDRTAGAINSLAMAKKVLEEAGIDIANPTIF